VKAFVVLEGGASADSAELIAYCRERLIKWSCPREVVFRDVLPKTRVGKIDVTALVREDVAASTE
jgi:long-chain acyl-CoA synthetase